MTRSFLAAGIFAFTLPALCSAGLSTEEQERFLLTANIVSRQIVATGTTKTSRITLSGSGLTHDAHVQTIDVYKAVYRTKEFVEKDFRDSYKYNIAAYRVARMIGIEQTPPCVFREVDGRPASVCWWVDDVQFDEAGRRAKKIEPPNPEYWTRQLNNIRVFDQLIDNTDRNQENVLIDKDWRLWMIDHSRAFRVTHQLRNPENLRRVSQRMLDGMRTLTYESASAALGQFLTEPEIRSMLVRRDLLLKRFSELVAGQGPEAVYTDLPQKTPHVTIP